MIKIRLTRMGAKKRPFYRVVVVDERNKRDGAYLDLLGTYNPLTEPKEIKLDQKKIDEWVKKGAQMSDGFLRIIGQAKQRPARKPKKEPKAKEIEGGREKGKERKELEEPVDEEVNGQREKETEETQEGPEEIEAAEDKEETKEPKQEESRAPEESTKTEVTTGEASSEKK